MYIIMYLYVSQLCTHVRVNSLHTCCNMSMSDNESMSDCSTPQQYFDLFQILKTKQAKRIFSSRLPLRRRRQQHFPPLFLLLLLRPFWPSTRHVWPILRPIPPRLSSWHPLQLSSLLLLLQGGGEQSKAVVSCTAFVNMLGLWTYEDCWGDDSKCEGIFEWL
jgi:hypothetical protein